MLPKYSRIGHLIIVIILTCIWPFFCNITKIQLVSSSFVIRCKYHDLGRPCFVQCMQTWPYGDYEVLDWKRSWPLNPERKGWRSKRINVCWNGKGGGGDEMRLGKKFTFGPNTDCDKYRHDWLSIKLNIRVMTYCGQFSFRGWHSEIKQLFRDGCSTVVGK